jgi:DNA-binding CsgD family transcriptional regulator
MGRPDPRIRPMPGSRHRGRPRHDDVLTPAEWRVVHAVQHGLSNREIALRRGISLDAVKQHVANAVAKLGVADRQGLRRWFAAPKRSALRSQEKPVEATLQLGAIGQISRTVSDIAAAESWYGRVLGLRHLYTFGKAAFFDCGGTRLYLTAEGAAGPESTPERAISRAQRRPPASWSRPPSSSAAAAASTCHRARGRFRCSGTRGSRTPSRRGAR